MTKWKWLALMPVLAAALVFGSSFFSGEGRTRDAAAGNSRSAVPASWRSDERPAESRDATARVDMTELGTSLLVVLGLAIGAIWVLRRLQRGTVHVDHGSSIRIKETRRLSAKRALHIVHVADRLLLLAEAETGLALVADLTPKGEEDAAPADFAPELDVDLERGAEPRDFVLRAATRNPASEHPQAPASLGNFRELLARLGAGAGTAR